MSLRRRSTLAFSTICFSYAAASDGVKPAFAARSAGRSSGVIVALVQTPCKSGWPSAVRGGAQVFLPASPCPAACWAVPTHIAAAITETRTDRIFMGSLPSMGCSLGCSFLRTRSPENPGDGIIPFMARVLVNRPGRLRHRNRCRPRLRKSRRILHREIVGENVGVGAREALDQAHVLGGPAKPRLACEVSGLNHQRVAFPVSARVPHPLPQAAQQMRTP